MKSHRQTWSPQRSCTWSWANTAPHYGLSSLHHICCFPLQQHLIHQPQPLELFVCLHASMTTFISVCLSVCLSVSLTLCLSHCQFGHLCTGLSVSLILKHQYTCVSLPHSCVSLPHSCVSLPHSCVSSSVCICVPLSPSLAPSLCG